MALPQLSNVDYILVLLCLGAVAGVQYMRGQRRKYPPGPPGYPIIGNMFDMPSEFHWLTFAQWSKEYNSPIVHANVLGQHIVSLNSNQVVNDLLEKRSNIYSDRPHSPILQDFTELGKWALPFMPHGPEWRIQRKKFHSTFHASTVPSYHPTEIESTRKLLHQLRDTPERYRDHINSHTGRIILKAVYGYDAKDEGDRYVWLTEEHFRHINERLISKFFLVDIFPILKHLPAWLPGFPGFNHQWVGSEYRKVSDELINVPFQDVHNLVKSGDATASIVSQDIEKTQLPDCKLTPAEIQEEFRHTKNMAATAYPAGQDTTASLISSIFLALTLHPEMGKRAQREIDAVTAGIRLPSFEDKATLPYIQCIVLEALRWNPAAPTAFTHRVIQDDEWNGYFIPKGSLIIGNTWALCHEEAIFPDPDTFNPDRYTRDKDGKPSSQETHVVAAFGYGRRVCPGRWLALETAWLTVAQLLAVYDVKRSIDDNGKEIIPKVKFTHGMTSHPEDWPCEIVPRSAESIKLLDD